MKWYLLLLFILIPVVTAQESSSVMLVNLHYDNGIITYNDRVIKCGYAPDYKIQPGEGYTAELISVDNKKLFSFTFEVPLKVTSEISDPTFKTISGGIVKLTTTDFTLSFPHFDDAKEVAIYNPRKFKVLSVPLIEEQFTKKPFNYWWLVILLLLALILIYAIHRHLKKEGIQP